MSLSTTLLSIDDREEIAVEWFGGNEDPTMLSWRLRLPGEPASVNLQFASPRQMYLMVDLMNALVKEYQDRQHQVLTESDEEAAIRESEDVDARGPYTVKRPIIS